VRGRPSSKPPRDYVISRLRELLLNAEIDMGDYVTLKVLQIYVTTYTSNSIQGLALVIARHKEIADYGLMANLAFRVSNDDIKLSVKNAIRMYEPLLSNLANLTRDLDAVFIFK
jgi:hypothetical protein